MRETDPTMGLADWLKNLNGDGAPHPVITHIDMYYDGPISGVCTYEGRQWVFLLESEQMGAVYRLHPCTDEEKHKLISGHEFVFRVDEETIYWTTVGRVSTPPDGIDPIEVVWNEGR